MFGSHFENCKKGGIEKVQKMQLLLSATTRKDDLMDQNQILQDDRPMFGEDSSTFEIFKMAAISKWPRFKVRYPDFSTFTDFDENWYSGYFGDGEQDGGVHFSKIQNGRQKMAAKFCRFFNLHRFWQKLVFWVFLGWQTRWQYEFFEISKWLPKNGR